LPSLKKKEHIDTNRRLQENEDGARRTDTPLRNSKTLIPTPTSSHTVKWPLALAEKYSEDRGGVGGRNTRPSFLQTFPQCSFAAGCVPPDQNNFGTDSNSHGCTRDGMARLTAGTGARLLSQAAFRRRVDWLENYILGFQSLIPIQNAVHSVRRPGIRVRRRVSGDAWLG